MKLFSQEADQSLDRKQIQTETRQGRVPNAISAVHFVRSLKLVVSGGGLILWGFVGGVQEFVQVGWQLGNCQFFGS